MGPVIHCPACGNPYVLNVMDNAPMDTRDLTITCATCKTAHSHRVSMQRLSGVGTRNTPEQIMEAEWALAFEALNRNAVERVLSGAFEKMRLKQTADEIARQKREMEEHRRRSEEGRRKAAEQRALQEALTPADGSYPPDPNEDEELGRIVQQGVGGYSNHSSVSWASASSDPMKDLKAAMKKLEGASYHASRAAMDLGERFVADAIFPKVPVVRGQQPSYVVRDEALDLMDRSPMPFLRPALDSLTIKPLSITLSTE